MRRLLLVTAILLTSSLAIAETPEQLYEQGQAAFDAEKYDAALTAWQRSYELSHEPGLLFNIAQAYRLRRQKGDCGKAAEAYRQFLAKDPDSSQHQIAEGFAADAAKCAAAERTAAPSQLQTSQPIEQQAVVQHPIDSTDEEPATGRTKKIAGLAVAGSGIVLVATGLYFGHQASSLGDEVENACWNGCDWAVYGSKDADGRSAQTLQYVFEGFGAAAIIGGAVLYWLGSRERASMPIAITSRRDGAAIVWRGAW